MKPHYQSKKVAYNCVTGEGLECLTLSQLESAALHHAKKNKHIKASLRRLYIGFIQQFTCGECTEGNDG